MDQPLQQEVRKQELQIQILVKYTRLDPYFGRPIHQVKVGIKSCIDLLGLDVSIHWTGLLDWNTGLDYWT